VVDCLLPPGKDKATRYAFRDASDFTPAMLTRAINKVNLSIDTHDATNKTGQFRLKKTLEVDGKSTRVIFCYTTEEGKPYAGDIPSSNDTAAWKKLYDRSQAAGEERFTRSRARATKARAWDEIDSALQEYHSLENFQKRLNEDTPGKKSVYDFPTYWKSTEAKKSFCPKPDETVEDALDRKIEALDNVMNEPGGYKLILPGDGDPDDHYKDHEKMTLIQKAMYLRAVYRVALEGMDTGWTWAECCEEAAFSLASIGFSMGSTHSLQLWNR
jgi:hypothetical protein